MVSKVEKLNSKGELIEEQFVPEDEGIEIFSDKLAATLLPGTYRIHNSNDIATVITETPSLDMVPEGELPPHITHAMLDTNGDFLNLPYTIGEEQGVLRITNIQQES